jgi:hypothetical protein
MSEPAKPEPDEDLLEFLGGIDEVNDDSKDSDFADFLANTDIDKVVAPPRPPTRRTPTKEEKSE